jgi:hypothetical protein
MAVFIHNSHNKTFELLYEGRVLETWVQEDRVLSDVYADCRYVRIWNPTTQKPETHRVKAFFELDPREVEVEVDATDIVLEQYQRYQRKSEALNRMTLVEQEVTQARMAAEDAWHAPVKGKTMVVTRSWKERKKGTVGIVFWVNGSRVGIRTSDARDGSGRWLDVIWCDAKHLANVEPFDYEIPEELTARLQDALDAAKEAGAL